MQLGQDVLQKIIAVGTTAHDEPAAQVTVTACGMTNHKGATCARRFSQAEVRQLPMQYEQVLTFACSAHGCHVATSARS